MGPGLLAGVDGYPSGWVVATLHDRAITWRTGGIHDLRRLIDDARIIAIDIPLLLGTAGWRECDRQAKAALGRAGARVFMTPPRAVLELGFSAPNDMVQELSRSLTGKGVSRQAMALGERILAADALLPDPRFYEVHPELVFTELAGTVLPSKKSAQGVGYRIRALDPWLAALGTACAPLLQECPADVPVDDALDALAALVGAVRIDGRKALRWPPSGDGPTIWA